MMKEELIKYVMERANKCYADDFPISHIESWITEFFDQHQPERSKREDLVRLKLCCPECKFEWQQDIDMLDHTDGISPCLYCGNN